ncbi:MAG: helix-turn-helix domain-containing protein [Blastocatellia bacterium]
MKFRDFLNEQIKDESFAKEYQEASQALELGIEIAMRREELGLTQKELANRTTIKQPMIARIEKGQIPTLPTLQKIAQALDSSITITGNKVSIVANNISQAA